MKDINWEYDWEEGEDRVGSKNWKEFQVGDRVFHQILGKGTIKSLTDDKKKISVRFDSGGRMKHFLASLNKFTII